MGLKMKSFANKVDVLEKAKNLLKEKRVEVRVLGVKSKQYVVLKNGAVLFGMAEDDDKINTQFWDGKIEYFNKDEMTQAKDLLTNFKGRVNNQKPKPNFFQDIYLRDVLINKNPANAGFLFDLYFFFNHQFFCGRPSMVARP
jgi:hypothetical protein